MMSNIDTLKLALDGCVPNILSPGWMMIPDKDFAAIKQALAAPVRDVPDGWKLVPVEPTDEMLDAAQAVVKDIYRVDADCVYLAMLNSAPEKGQP
jgi:hypothetical protein